MTAIRKRNLAGFTLVELSIVLVIIALVAGAALTAGTTRLRTAKLSQTQLKLDKIEEAIGAYLILNRRLPCPADGSLAVTAAPSAPNATFPNGNGGFGREWRNTTNTDCNAALAPTGGGGRIFVGVVPAIALNLPDEFVFDAWGRRITYVVDSALARDVATFSATPGGRINVTDAAGGFRTVNPAFEPGACPPNPAGGFFSPCRGVYVVMSHGEDGEGAWTQGGGAARFNPSGAALVAPQLENSHTPGTFNSFNDTFVQSSPQSAPIFDDIVRFRLKWQVIRMAGGIVDVSVCDLANRTLQALNDTVAPKQGPVGCLIPSACTCTGAGCTCAVTSAGTPQAECVIRQQLLANQISTLCFN